MGKYKNVILIVIAVVLFIYAGFITIVPSIATSSFNKEKFEQQCYDASALVTKIGGINFKMQPNFTTIITIRNISFKYVDYQDLFDASFIKIETTPAAIFGGKFKIKSMEVKNAVYVDQVLADNTNKLSYLPASFNSKIFGKKSITIYPGPVHVKGFDIKYVGPNSFKEKKIREKLYSKAEVKSFLSSYNYNCVKIK